MENKAPDPVFVLRGASDPISSLDFIQPKSDDCYIRYLASGTQEGNVSIWDLKTRGTIFSWKAHDSSVLWLKFLNFPNLWTGGRNDSVVLWDISETDAKVKVKFSLGEYLGFSLSDVRNSGEQNLLCTPGPLQECVTLWDVKSGLKICSLKPPDGVAWGTVMQFKWVELENKLFMLVAYESGSIVLWDWSNMKIISDINCKDNPVSLEFDPVLKKGICGTASEKIIIFGVTDNDELYLEKDFCVTNPGTGAVCSRPDSKLYTTGGWDYRLRLFSWKSHKPLAVLMYHKKSIQTLAYSLKPVESLNNKGYLLAAGSCDNSISLWDIYNE